MKSRCLATITKAVHYATPEQLRQQLRDVTISSFIASLLATSDGTTNVAAVRLAELLMSKLPEVLLSALHMWSICYAMHELKAAVLVRSCIFRRLCSSKLRHMLMQPLKFQCFVSSS